jgi:hypothetical protein
MVFPQPVKAEKVPASGRIICPVSEEKEKKNSLKMNKPCGDIYENKGSVFHSLARSGNVIENKGCYA